ncbi:MAG: acyl-CoA thioesterase, partial [Ferrovibrionaceae bacterium]
VNQTIDFKNELLAGDLVVMKSGVAAVGKKSITVFHKLINAETGAISMTAQVTGVLMDLETRKAVPVPDDVRTKAERLMVQEIPA